MTNFELYFRSNSVKVRKEYLAPFAICFFDGNNSSMEVPKVYQSKPERFKNAKQKNNSILHTFFW